ncbi:hypothetical protein HMPREF9449_02150 [Odoribacter laneus YIT 12061]|uniref:Uncharacterized protein n=1 Tax=Odoribacter laneus YIT 12061 TaxID=742817 RepID=H1DIC1_9BACT|nr:hypothetical protein HMPREF9449_02150 [Odoribacter laneus YIT 12061]
MKLSFHIKNIPKIKMENKKRSLEEKSKSST